MAMNKKEQAAFDAMRDEVRIARALRLTEPVAPDVPPPTTFNGLSTGYLFGRSHVDVACSNAVHHAFGRNDKTTTQGARALFSSRLLALRALRHCMEREYAKNLAEIDRQIEQELSGEGK